MFDFIKDELVEARLFKYPDNLKGRSSLDLAKLLFSSILVLEILKVENESQAWTYVNRTMAFNDFDHMRSGTTDLANMIAVLSNQNDYQDQLKTKIGLYAPALQIKTYLRTFSTNTHSHVRSFLIKLDEDLMIAGSDLHQARRTVSDWADATPGEKSLAWATLTRVFNQQGTQLDIWVLAKNYFMH